MLAGPGMPKVSSSACGAFSLGALGATVAALLVSVIILLRQLANCDVSSQVRAFAIAAKVTSAISTRSMCQGVTKCTGKAFSN